MTIATKPTKTKILRRAAEDDDRDAGQDEADQHDVEQASGAAVRLKDD
jgi:hypothetical protein